MAKKKAIKLAAASAVAASAFVAAAPAQTDAASNVAVEVSKAVTQMKKAYHTYSDVTAQGKFAPIADVYKEYNAAKASYKNAKALVTKAGGEHKEAYLAQLDATYNEYIAKRVVTYIDAFNYATALEDKKEALEAALEAKEWDKAEDLYHEISYELKTRTVILHRVYGQTARNLLVDAFKVEAQDTRDSITNEVSVKMYYEKAEDLVAEGKLEEAKKAMDHVADFVSKLDKDTDFGAALLTKVSEVKAAYEAKLAPAVESVSAITLKTVEVKFNKAINKDSIADGEIAIGSTSVAAADITLSDDKKTATIALGLALTNNSSHRVVIDGILATDGKSVSKFDKVVTLSDAAAPTLKATDYVKANNSATLTFSEPLTSIGTVTLTDKNGVTTVVSPTFNPGEDTASISTSSLADGAYTVTIVGATDLAGKYFAGNKVVTSFTVGSSDTTAPTVSNIEVVNKNLVKVTFSEKLFATGTVALNGAAALTLTKDANLDTAGDYSVDSTGLVYTINVGTLNNDSFNKLAFAGQSDLAGNAIVAVEKTFSHVDTAAPQLLSTKVEGSKVTLTFNENVALSGTETAKFVAPNGVLKTVTDAHISVGTNPKTVVVDLATYVGTLQNGSYSLEFAKDAIADLDANSASYKTSFSLTSAADVTAPEVVDANGVTAGNVGYANGTVTVRFNEAMGQSALDLNNYTVDGQKVFKSAYFNNSTQEVVLTLNDSVFSSTANRLFKVENVKDEAGNVLKDGSYSETIQFSENVKPALLSAVASNDGTKLTLTFSESLDDATIGTTEGAAAADFQVLVDGVAQAYTNEVAVADSNNTKYEIVFSTPLTPTQLAKVITLKPVSTIDVADTVGNTLTTFTTVNVTK